jgi:ribonuclease VapC
MIVVLDASALLAFLHQESGWEKVHAILDSSWICAMNWCEVVQKADSKGLDTRTLREPLEELGLSVIPFSVEQAEIAAHLWKTTRQHGLSLADRACLALAMDNRTRVFTADKAWATLGLDLDIQLVR